MEPWEVWRRTLLALARAGKGRAQRALRQPLRRGPSLEKAAAIAVGTRELVAVGPRLLLASRKRIP